MRRRFSLLTTVVVATAGNSAAASDELAGVAMFLASYGESEAGSIEVHCDREGKRGPDGTFAVPCRVTRLSVRRQPGGVCKISELSHELWFSRTADGWTKTVPGQICKHLMDVWTLTKSGAAWRLTVQSVQLRKANTELEARCGSTSAVTYVDPAFVESKPKFRCEDVSFSIW